MGNQVAKQKLYRSIAKAKIQKVKGILQLHPDLVNQVLTSDSKMTPLLKAIVHNNFQIIQLLISLGADPSLPNPRGITPLMMSSIRDNMTLVKYFIQNLHVDETAVSDQGFTPLDYAIYSGNYELAQYLYERKVVGLKEVEAYETVRKKLNGRFVNYPVFILHLEKKLTTESLPEYLKPVKPCLKDPVVDPRQRWGEMISRIANFQYPPMVQRSKLPQGLRPQNRNVLSRLRTRIQNGKSQMSSVSYSPPKDHSQLAIISKLRQTREVSDIELQNL